MFVTILNAFIALPKLVAAIERLEAAISLYTLHQFRADKNDLDKLIDDKMRNDIKGATTDDDVREIVRRLSNLYSRS